MSYDAFLNEQLTPHFKRGEFFVTTQDGGQEHLVEDFFNLPMGVQADILTHIKDLAEALEHLRKKLGKPFVIGSGWRSARVNKLVGGEDKSLHMKGMAADVTVVGMDPTKVFNLLTPGWGGGLGHYPKTRWRVGFTHIDIRKQRARWNG